MDTKKNKVGIFMRVYRKEPTIHRAINSVLNQTYRDFKYYILVNQNTKKIIDKYKKKDKRIVVIEGKPNEGFRNYAKDIAKENEYITTIDADDWYDVEYIEQLLSIAEKNKADMVACGNYYVDDNNRIVGSRYQKNLFWEQKDINRVLPFVYGHFRTIWGKLYRSRILTKSNFQNIPESSKYGGYGGDTLFVFNLFSETKRFYLSDKLLYYYQISQTGGTKMLSQGRIDSDEILFGFTENILSSFEGYGENQKRYLFIVYGYALVDTVKLLLEKDQVQKILYVLEKPISKELFVREEKGLVEIEGLPKSIKFAEVIKNILFDIVFMENGIGIESVELLKIMGGLYPRLTNSLSKNEFELLVRDRDTVENFIIGQDRSIVDKLIEIFPKLDDNEQKDCINLFSKLNIDIIFRTMLEDREFFKEYLDIGLLLNKEKYEEVSKVLKTYFSGETYPYKSEQLVSLWNNIAARLENIEEYTLTLQLRVEILSILGKRQEAVNQLYELIEMNVENEFMEELKNILLEEPKGMDYN